MPFGDDSPFDDLEELIDRMRREFESATGGLERIESLGGPAIDVVERDDEYVVTVDLPGFTREEIDVRLADNTLRVEAEHEETSEMEAEGTYIQRERRERRAARSVQLPGPVEAEGVSATASSGVLTVTLPKADGDGGQRIEIE